MRDSQCLDTNLNLTSDFTGKQTRISVNRSALFAMASAANALLPEDISRTSAVSVSGFSSPNQLHPEHL